MGVDQAEMWRMVIAVLVGLLIFELLKLVFGMLLVLFAGALSR